MKLRHAAALSLVGWYLMLPPVQRPYNKVEVDAPISQWRSIGSFESAHECERSRLAGIRETKFSEETMRSDVARRNVHIEALASECIATDDPRLKAK